MGRGPENTCFSFHTQDLFFKIAGDPTQSLSDNFPKDSKCSFSKPPLSTTINGYNVINVLTEILNKDIFRDTEGMK